MKFNTIHFFLYISNHRYLCTVEFIEGQKSDHFMMAMNNITALYRSHGFQITPDNIYGELKPICSVLLGLGITLNTVSRDEHVPEAERNVRTDKDQF